MERGVLKKGKMSKKRVLGKKQKLLSQRRNLASDVQGRF